jgi:hypothetical protein
MFHIYITGVKIELAGFKLKYVVEYSGNQFHRFETIYMFPAGTKRECRNEIEDAKTKKKNLISIDVMHNLFQYHHVGLLLHFKSQMLLLFYYLKNTTICFLFFLLIFCPSVRSIYVWMEKYYIIIIITFRILEPRKEKSFEELMNGCCGVIFFV